MMMNSCNVILTTYSDEIGCNELEVNPAAFPRFRLHPHETNIKWQN